MRVLETLTYLSSPNDSECSILLRVVKETTPTRRERLRAQTQLEIREHAWEQISADGIEALSLNAVARAMGMSGPALYRYYDSRDELLAALVADAWGSLADALEQAARSSRRKEPKARFHALGVAYRAWALERPHRYKLALETHYGSGRFAPDSTLPQAGRSMVVVLDAIMDLGPLPAARLGSIRALDSELVRWRDSRGLRTDAGPAALELALLTMARVHGVVSLELTGTFESMALDGALIQRDEINLLLAHHQELRGDATE